MAKYRIEFERDKCIGARSCNDACPDNWEMKPDGKSDCNAKEFDDDRLMQYQQTILLSAVKEKMRYSHIDS